MLSPCSDSALDWDGLKGACVDDPQLPRSRFILDHHLNSPSYCPRHSTLTLFRLSFSLSSSQGQRPPLPSRSAPSFSPLAPIPRPAMVDTDKTSDTRDQSDSTTSTAPTSVTSDKPSTSHSRESTSNYASSSSGVSRGRARTRAELNPLSSANLEKRYVSSTRQPSLRPLSSIFR